MLFFFSFHRFFLLISIPTLSTGGGILILTAKPTRVRNSSVYRCPQPQKILEQYRPVGSPLAHGRLVSRQTHSGFTDERGHDSARCIVISTQDSVAQRGEYTESRPVRARGGTLNY